MPMLVEVCYASESVQFLQAVEVLEQCCVREAIWRSGVLEQFPEIDLKQQKLGIFSKIVQLDDQLQPGDRIEIYRPLKIDPKQARRLRATSR